MTALVQREFIMLYADHEQRRRQLTKLISRDVLLVDLDGTLTDPAEGIIGCFRFALDGVGRSAPPASDLTWIIGPPLRHSFAKLMGGTADVERALAIYRSRYAKEGLFEATVYDGAREMLAELKSGGTRLFLCTSKPVVYADRILRRFDLDPLFEAAYGAELDGRFDDKGDLIALILSERALDPNECVMLGDRKHDVTGAALNGVPAIGALWGYGGEEELRAAGAALLCASPAEVPAALQNFPIARGSWQNAAP